MFYREYYVPCISSLLTLSKDRGLTRDRPSLQEREVKCDIFLIQRDFESYSIHFAKRKTEEAPIGKMTYPNCTTISKEKG
jgi:hypothetical protein